MWNDSQDDWNKLVAMQIKRMVLNITRWRMHCLVDFDNLSIERCNNETLQL